VADATAATPRVGYLAIGRRRPGFDPSWGQEVQAAGWDACERLFTAVRPSTPVVDDATLRQAMAEFQKAACDTVVVLQPTMGDGRLAPVLMQLWNGPVVLWATPERPDAERVTACSLVGTHVFASMFRQMGKPFEFVYGSPSDSRTESDLSEAVRTTAAARWLGRAKVGLIGYHAPGFINMHADPMAISRQLGVTLQHIGLAEFQDRLAAIETTRVDRDLQQVRGMDLGGHTELADEELMPNSRYRLAISDLMQEENLQAVALRCWPELPTLLGHWPYLAMMRLTEAGQSVCLEGDVDGAILGFLGARLALGTGYVSDWLAHDDQSMTLWHPGHAPRDFCVPESLRLGRHFNNDKPLVVNAQLLPEQPITLARLWRCDDRYHLVAFTARTGTPQRPLSGAHGLARVDGLPVRELFERLCHAGMPHHVTVFRGNCVTLLRRVARQLRINWLELH